MGKWKLTTKAKRDLKTYFRLHGVDEKDCERAADNLIACILVGHAKDLLPAKSSARDMLENAFECAFDDLVDTQGYLSRKYPALHEYFMLDALALVTSF